MEQQLSALYNKLARHMVSMIPVDWDEIYYLGEVEPERASWSSVFYFREASSGTFVQSNSIPRAYQIPKPAYLTAWMALNDILLEIYDCFASNGQKPWEQLTFFADRSGKFKADFHYDVMGPDDGGQLARQRTWARDTFGYEP